MTGSHVTSIQARIAERTGAEITTLVARFPGLETALTPFEGVMPSFLVDPAGDGRIVDLVTESGRYYGRDARDVAAEQVARALSERANIECRMPMPTAAHGRLHDISQELLRAGEFAEELPARIDGGLENGRSRLLFLAGLGLGHHVARLIDELDPRYVVIYEPQPQLLYCASFTVPWRRLIAKLSGEGRSLLVLSGDSAEVSAQKVKGWLETVPAVNVDGGRWVQHYDHPGFGQLKSVVAEHVRMLNKAPGFFIDERRQFIHTLANLPKTQGVLAERRPRSLDGDLILVGSGPSLDEALPLIARARDRAIIFSCGTGLTPLLRAGILPDFHIELETSSGRYALASAVEDPTVFRTATLIASNGYYPPSFDLFERRLMFLRPGNFAAWVFRALGTPLLHGAPTVTNAAAALAHYLGLRRIFAFGVDLGYYDTAVQHSRRSLYFDEKKQGFHPDFAHLPGGQVLRSFYPTSEIEVPDNRGGRILTNDIFYRSLRAFDAFIHDEKVELIHCGQGARIWGSQVRRIDELSEADFSCDRNSVLSGISARFSAVNAAALDLDRVVAVERGNLSSFVSVIDGIVRAPIVSLTDFLDRANAVSRRIRESVNESEVGPQRLVGGEYEKLTMFAADLARSARDRAVAERVWDTWRSEIAVLGAHVQAEMATVVAGQGIDPIPGVRRG